MEAPITALDAQRLDMSATDVYHFSLAHAIKTGDFKAATELLQRDFNVVTDYSAYVVGSPLLLAIFLSNAKMMHLLLQAKPELVSFAPEPELDLLRNIKMEPILFAYLHNNLDAVLILMQYRASIVPLLNYSIGSEQPKTSDEWQYIARLPLEYFKRHPQHRDIIRSNVKTIASSMQMNCWCGTCASCVAHDQNCFEYFNLMTMLGDKESLITAFRLVYQLKDKQLYKNDIARLLRLYFFGPHYTSISPAVDKYLSRIMDKFSALDAKSKRKKKFSLRTYQSIYQQLQDFKIELLQQQVTRLQQQLQPNGQKRKVDDTASTSRSKKLKLGSLK